MIRINLLSSRQQQRQRAHSNSRSGGNLTNKQVGSILTGIVGLGLGVLTALILLPFLIPAQAKAFFESTFFLVFATTVTSLLFGLGAAVHKRSARTGLKFGAITAITIVTLLAVYSNFTALTNYGKAGYKKATSWGEDSPSEAVVAKNPGSPETRVIDENAAPCTPDENSEGWKTADKAQVEPGTKLSLHLKLSNPREEFDIWWENGPYDKTIEVDGNTKIVTLTFHNNGELRISKYPCLNK